MSISREGGIRLVLVDGHPVDMKLGDHTLLTRHHRPEIVGKTGSILGAQDVNIAAMHVARRSLRGEAVMVLALDEPISPGSLEEIRAIDGIFDARYIHIPRPLVRDDARGEDG